MFFLNIWLGFSILKLFLQTLLNNDCSLHEDVLRACAGVFPAVRTEPLASQCDRITSVDCNTTYHAEGNETVCGSDMNVYANLYVTLRHTFTAVCTLRYVTLLQQSVLYVTSHYYSSPYFTLRHTFTAVCTLY